MGLLLSLKLEDWKSFGSGPDAKNKVNFAAPLTVLVGPNASGKSNALDALRFLQGAGIGHSLGEVLRGRWEGQREIWPGIRGGIVEAARSGTASFGLSSAWLLGDLAEILPGAIEHRLRVGTQADAAVEEEGLFEGLFENDSSPYLFWTHAPSLPNKGRVRGSEEINLALRASEGRKDPWATLRSTQSLLGQIELAGLTATRSSTSAARLLRAAFREIVFLPQLGSPGTTDLDRLGGARPVKVLLIPEDQTHDQYIIKPIVEALFADLEVPARVSVLPEPRLRGYSQALDPEIIGSSGNVGAVL